MDIGGYAYPRDTGRQAYVCCVKTVAAGIDPRRLFVSLDILLSVIKRGFGPDNNRRIKHEKIS